MTASATLTLSDFLLARIAEDEKVARGAIGHSLHISTDWEGAATQRHIYRWSSARVLAECEAKRRIVELHREVPSKVQFSGYPRELTNHCSQGCETDGILHDDVYYIKLRERPRWPCRTLRLLALPYADHPDYREAWRP